MTDVRSLLERHRPRLVYDSQEAYFADAAGVWTDAPSNVLKRRQRDDPGQAAELSLAFLGPHVYGDRTQALSSDTIGETTRDYAKHAAAMHRQAPLRQPHLRPRPARCRRAASGSSTGSSTTTTTSSCSARC